MTSAVWAWLAAHWPALLAGWATVSPAIEYVLGIKSKGDPARAASIVEAVGHLFGWLKRKMTGAPAPLKGVVFEMPKNPNAIVVQVEADKPTADLLDALNETVEKLAAGAKPADVVQAELGKAFSLMQEIPLIPADAKADPESVEAAIALGLVKLGKTLRAHLLAPSPAVAPGK